VRDGRHIPKTLTRKTPGGADSAARWMLHMAEGSRPLADGIEWFSPAAGVMRGDRYEVYIDRE